MVINKQEGTVRRKPPAAGMGRVKGSLNKSTAILKDAILRAAALSGQDKKGKAGLVGYCRRLADDEPKAFCGLLGRVLPTQVSGIDDKPIQVDMITDTVRVKALAVFLAKTMRKDGK